MLRHFLFFIHTFAHTKRYAYHIVICISGIIFLINC